MNVKGSDQDEDSDNALSIIESTQSDDVAVEINDEGLQDQNTLKLLIRQLKLNLLELKVAQKLQNTNLLLHINQLKKKYNALKSDVDKMKSEKNKECKKCPAIDVNQITNETSLIFPSIDLTPNNQNDTDNEIKTLANECNISVDDVTVKEEIIDLEHPNNDLRVENDTDVSSSFPEVYCPPSMPKIVSVTSGSNLVVDSTSVTSQDTVVTNKAEDVNTDQSISESSQSSNTNNSDTNSTEQRNIITSMDVEVHLIEDLSDSEEAERIVPSNNAAEELSPPNVYSSISNYLEMEFNKKIDVISYSKMKPSEWVVLNSSKNTIIVCIKSYENGSFSISIVKTIRKSDPNKETFYLVSYKFLQQEESQECETNKDDGFPQSEAAQHKRHNRLSSINKEYSGVRKFVAENVCDLSCIDEIVNSVITTQVDVHCNRNQAKKSIGVRDITNDQRPHSNVNINHNSRESDLETINKLLNTPEKSRLSVNSTPEKSRRPINDKVRSRNIADMFKSMSPEKKANNFTHCQPVRIVNENNQSLLHNGNKLVNPLPAVPSTSYFNNSHQSEPMNWTPVRDYQHSEIIRRENRNRRKKQKRKNRHWISDNLKNNHRITAQKLSTLQKLRRLANTSLNASPQKVFVRTEKKQLTNLPSVVIREHVTLDYEDEEQVLPMNRDDDVCIVEQVNNPIEID